jgi:hypothetical protein
MGYQITLLFHSVAIRVYMLVGLSAVPFDLCLFIGFLLCCCFCVNDDKSFHANAYNVCVFTIMYTCILFLFMYLCRGIMLHVCVYMF